MTNREIDALVAEKVMGYQWCKSHFGTCRWLAAPNEKAREYPHWPLTPATEELPLCSDWSEMVPHYTTDPAAAFQVVDAMIRKGLRFGLDTSGTTFEAYFVVRGLRYPWKSPNPATAICRAALSALGIEVNDGKST